MLPLQVVLHLTLAAIYHEQVHLASRVPYGHYQSVCEWSSQQDRVVVIAKLLMQEKCISANYTPGCQYTEWQVLRVCSGRIESLPACASARFPWVTRTAPVKIGDEALLAVRSERQWTTLTDPPPGFAQWGEEFISKSRIEAYNFPMELEPNVCFIHKVSLRRRAYLAELMPHWRLSDIFCPTGEIPSTFQEVCATVRRVSAFVVAEAEQRCGRKFMAQETPMYASSSAQTQHSTSVALLEGGEVVDRIQIYITPKERLRWNLEGRYVQQHAVSAPSGSKVNDTDFFHEAKRRLHLTLSPLSLDEVQVDGASYAGVGGIGQLRCVAYRTPNEGKNGVKDKAVRVYFTPITQFIAWYQRDGL